MADQWYYSEQGKQKGPLSREELERLASTGRLKPTDKVWTKGMSAWMPASQVEGLTLLLAIDSPASLEEPPPIPSQSVEPPSLPAEAATPPGPSLEIGKKARELATSLGRRGKAAARLVAKQAERMKITTITLPHAHLALGKHVHGAGNCREDFAEVHQRIDTILAEISSLQTHADQPKSEGVAEKAKAAARATKDAARAQALKVKVNSAFTELGRAAFDKHGDASGPGDVVQPVATTRARLEQLDQEIGQLSQSPPGQIVTPKRIAVAGLATAAIVVVLLAKGVFFGSDSKDVGQVPATDAATPAPKQVKEQGKSEAASQRAPSPEAGSPQSSPRRFVADPRLLEAFRKKPSYEPHYQTGVAKAQSSIEKIDAARTPKERMETLAAAAGMLVYLETARDVYIYEGKGSEKAIDCPEFLTAIGNYDGMRATFEKKGLFQAIMSEDRPTGVDVEALRRESDYEKAVQLGERAASKCIDSLVDASAFGQKFVAIALAAGLLAKSKKLSELGLQSPEDHGRAAAWLGEYEGMLRQVGFLSQLLEDNRPSSAGASVHPRYKLGYVTGVALIRKRTALLHTLHGEARAKLVTISKDSFKDLENARDRLVRERGRDDDESRYGIGVCDGAKDELGRNGIYDRAGESDAGTTKRFAGNRDDFLKELGRMGARLGRSYNDPDFDNKQVVQVAASLDASAWTEKFGEPENLQRRHDTWEASSHIWEYHTWTVDCTDGQVLVVGSFYRQPHVNRVTVTKVVFE